MSKQSVFNSKLQYALDCLVEDSIKPFDPYRFLSILESSTNSGDSDKKQKSDEIPNELKRQSAREFLYILKQQMKKQLQEKFNQLSSALNIPGQLETFEEQYFQRQVLKNLDVYQDQREFLVCSQNYDSDSLVNSIINEAIIDSILQI